MVEEHFTEIPQNRKWFHQREISKKILDKVSNAIENETSRIKKEEMEK